MITVSKQENGVLFTFQNSDKYLYGSGTIEVPFNSLSIIQDESDNITLRKSASNDIFLSARYDTDFGYASKEEAVNALKEILYDEAGISEEEVQEMIDAATSGIPSSEVVEQLRADVNTLSGKVDTKVDATTYESGQYATAQALNALQDNKQDTLSAGTGIEISGNVISATGGSSVTVDTELDETSNNPVANSAITNAITSIESSITSVSNDLNTLSGAVIDNEYTVSQAINSLNNRVIAVESTKQDTLVSGTNIKTINGESILGEGNITIEGGGGGGTGLDDDTQQLISTALNDLNDRKADLTELTKYQKKGDYVKTSTLADYMTNDAFEVKERIISGALNDLNDKFGGLKLVKLTQAEYDALATKDSSALYIISD